MRSASSPLLPLVAEAGYLYDSSLAPFPGAGRLTNPRWPTRLRWRDGGGRPPRELLELPPLTFGGPLRLPAGSWTGRLVGSKRVARAARRQHRRGALPVAVIHPWEITGRPTPGTLTGLARFIHETGRLAYRQRFLELLAALPWDSLSAACAGAAAVTPVTPSAPAERAVAMEVEEETVGAVAAGRTG